MKLLQWCFSAFGEYMRTEEKQKANLAKKRGSWAIWSFCFSF
jgi:hypothetical protein